MIGSDGDGFELCPGLDEESSSRLDANCELLISDLPFKF